MKRVDHDEEAEALVAEAEALIAGEDTAYKIELMRYASSSDPELLRWAVHLFTGALGLLMSSRSIRSLPVPRQTIIKLGNAGFERIGELMWVSDALLLGREVLTSHELDDLTTGLSACGLELPHRVGPWRAGVATDADADILAIAEIPLSASLSLRRVFGTKYFRDIPWSVLEELADEGDESF